jgi:WD40 repeat protein
MDYVNCMALSLDRKFAVSESVGGHIRVWDSEADHSWELSNDAGYVHDIAISPDKTYIAFSNDNAVCICRVYGDGFQERVEYTDNVYCLAFRPDGGAIVSGSRGIGMYDMQTKATLFLKENVRCTNCVAFSPNGKQVASGSADAAISVWDFEAGTAKILSGHNEEIFLIAWSPDGRYLASSQYAFIRVWDIATEASRVYVGEGCASLSFSPNGRYLATGYAVFAFSTLERCQH